MRQGLGVQGQRLLLQPDHHRPFPGVSVREFVRQAQLSRRSRGRVLGLPLLHHRRLAVRAARVRDDRRQDDADEGDRGFPRPRRQQDLL